MTFKVLYCSVWMACRRGLIVTKNTPYACRNFHACAFAGFQKPQQLGRAPGSVVVDRHITCSASQARYQRPALLQAAAETTGKEDLKAVRRVRHYKEVGLQE